MTVHLLKMAVGSESVSHLVRVQRARLERARGEDGTGDLRHLTRNMPRRANLVLDGGSMYWVIKGYVRVRQRILGLERVAGREGRRRCPIILDPELQRTQLVPHRPIQGWRYLEPDGAPVDFDELAPAGSAMPVEMAAELRALGLL